jgi:serine/threonine protein kinase
MITDMQSDEQPLDPAAHQGDKYRPIARIGRGGMAEVLLAVLAGPAQVRKLLVLKRPLSILSRDADFNTRFLAEARIASRLNHPNVISTFEVGLSTDGPFIVMEYLDGQPLSKIYRRLGALQMPLSYRLHVLRNLLAGLDYVHTLADFDGRGLRLVHRDVSPQNVFVCYDGRVALVDFGIAKAEGLGRNSRPGVIEGKIAYMAPEQLSGRPADHRADLFAFGVILWETLTGQRITLGAPEDEIVRRRTRGDIPDIRQHAPETPQALVDLCQRTLTLLPEDRISSAAAIIETLDAFIDRMGARINDREVGQYIGNAFSAERDARRRLIESQMAVVEQGMLPAPGSLPDLSRALSPADGSDPYVDGFALSLADSDEPYEPASLPPGEITRVTVPLTLNRTATSPTLVPTGNPEAPDLAIRDRRVLYGLSALALVIAVVLGWTVSGGSPSPAKPSVPPAALPGVAATPPTAGPTAPTPEHRTGEATIVGGAQNITIGFKQLPAAATAPAPLPTPADLPTPATHPAPASARPRPVSQAETHVHRPVPVVSATTSPRSPERKPGRTMAVPGESLRRPSSSSFGKATIDADNPYAH